MLGKVIGGRYQIIRYLGGGGFGRTYLAEDWHLPGKPQCVVKQLKPRAMDEASLQTARRLFNQEAQVLYALGNYDQIPQLFAHFEEEQEFYLVQEFIDGVVLDQELKNGELTGQADIMGLLLDIMITLEFVHRQQVIHRDIKPSNLIRRRSDRKIVLIDFGAVKQISGIESLNVEPQSSVTIAVGSAGYMPNEQLAGKPRYNSDIYAVGMVGIRALTGLYPGQLPEDPRTGEVIWRDKTEVSDELANILDKMVRYDFRQRYQSVAEVLNALGNLAPHSAMAVTPAVKAIGLDELLVWGERGDELVKQQRYAEAVACYDRAIQATPNDYLVWFKRGIALENLQDYEAAVESYDQVIRLRAEDYLAWFKRGKALENLQQYEAAVECYDKVIEIQPENYWAWYERAKVLENSQQYEEAVAIYDRAIQLKPDFQLAIDRRKRLLSQLKQVDQLYGHQHYEEAIASCDRTLQAKPDDSLAWLMRGMALEKLQHYEDAATSYNRVVEIQPDDHIAWFKHGTVMEQLKRYKEAIQSYNKVVQLQPDNYWAWHDRGRVLETIHRYEPALASYDKASQLKPDFQAALEGRRRVLNYLKHGQAQLEPSNP
jgi:tetratricopeptide (TPR) repeat protein